MTDRKLWVELRSELYEFQTITNKLPLYEKLISTGIHQESLDHYIMNGHGRKKKLSTILPEETTKFQLNNLLEMGGCISGGASVRKWLYLDGVKDYDVFFPNIVSFVKGHLAVFDNPIIDVCLYRNTPYELFDITASESSYSNNGFLNSEKFELTMETGMSDINLSTIVDPQSTLRRISKYGKLYGLKFPVQKVMLLAMTPGIDPDIVKESMEYTI